MINSRVITDLLPVVQPMVQAFINACAAADIDLIITSSYRDAESQDALYAQGRTTPGYVVTNAKGGQSYHQYRCAVDVCPIVNGKCVWDTTQPIWAKVSKIGKAQGLEWAGDWVSFKEMAHFQYTGGLSIADLQSGGTIV